MEQIHPSPLLSQLIYPIRVSTTNKSSTCWVILGIYPQIESLHARTKTMINIVFSCSVVFLSRCNLKGPAITWCCVV